MISPNDDITKFEYLKKSSQNTGTVIIGIQLKNHNDLPRLKEKVQEFDPSNIYINDNKMLYSTPTILVLGDSDLKYVPTPEIKPPPPIAAYR